MEPETGILIVTIDDAYDSLCKKKRKEDISCSSIATNYEAGGNKPLIQILLQEYILAR
ncbi:hypothetical protein P4H35_29300 [Paenibacillus taichungensis]|uniref:hypothetical protein n=1 Tax=Paenibacillus taichungensis TaxID=484184 RepID=UPI002DBAF304|nr:hypothetical protein [Paenibacillus taichungensis]MEC0200442.1 hypothetical protein [Paenibacillus taichungensis]